MKQSLRSKMVMPTVLIVLALSMVGIETGYSQNTFEEGNLIYAIRSGYKVTVMGHVNGQNAYGVLTIPESVSHEGHNYSVTAIGEDAFMGSPHLIGDLVIPNSVIEIGQGAFEFCTGFNGSLVLGNSVERIGDAAFDECVNLVGGLVIPNSVTTIGNSAFAFCSNLTGDLIIPSSITEIGECAFSNCEGFDGILSIGNAVEIIGSGAFSNCRNLTGNLVIPNTVTEIGDAAFSECEGLTGDLVIPDAVIELGSNAFENCRGFNSLTISNSVETIKDEAFYGCLGFVGDLVIPNSVVEIWPLAFANCSGFSSLTVGSSLLSIFDEAFKNNNFERIVVDEDNPLYDSRDDCNAIVDSYTNTIVFGCKGTVIPESVTAIGDAAFYGVEFPGLFVLPESIQSIGYLAFIGCVGLDIVFSNNPNPPTINNSFHHGMPQLEVSCGAKEAYEASDWANYFNYIEQDCVSVNEGQDFTETSIYPNPTSDKIVIVSEGLSHIVVSNMLGQCVYDSPVNGDEYTFDFDGYDSGIYLIRIETTNGVATKRVVLTK